MLKAINFFFLVLFTNINWTVHFESPLLYVKSFLLQSTLSFLLSQEMHYHVLTSSSCFKKKNYKYVQLWLIILPILPVARPWQNGFPLKLLLVTDPILFMPKALLFC